jgi:hypothetical protein
MLPFDEADGEVPHFARIPRGGNDDRASPKRRSGGETEAVLGLIARALDWVPIKFHFEFVLTLSRIATAINRAQAHNLQPRRIPATHLFGAFQTVSGPSCGIRV